MRIDTRLERLERKVTIDRFDLTCPECGQRYILFGDTPLDLLTAEWEIRADSFSPHFNPGPELWELARHEHDPWQFVESRSGLALKHPYVSGFGFAVAAE